MPETSRTVPTMAGQTVDEATATLEKMKLKWTQTTETSATYPEGQIIRSDPGAGIVVATGDTINLYVSTGKKTVAVPDVHNMNLDAAKAAITAAGLTVGRSRPRTPPPSPPTS